MSDGRTASITIAYGETTYTAARLLICTGSEAFVPPIPGTQGNEAVLTNREILALTEAPQSLVVIGGGVIGMEFASLYNSLGIPVTVIEMLPEILGGLDSEISAALRGIYAKRGVKFNLQCKVTAIEGNIGRNPTDIALDKRIPHASIVAPQVKNLQKCRKTSNTQVSLV